MKYLEKKFYVSNTAEKRGDGSINEPFPCLEEAKKAIKEYREQIGEYTCVHITVYLREGIYYLEDTFQLDMEDGGSKNQKVTYAAYSGEEVVFDGGTHLDPSLFRPVTEVEGRQLKNGMEQHVFVAELDKEEVEQYLPNPEMECKNFGVLAWGDSILQLAQWPNHGYVHMKEVIDRGPSTRHLLKGESAPEYSWENPSGGRFTTHESTDFSRIDEETGRTKEVYCYGYVHNDWYFQKEKVHSVKNDEIRFLKDTTYGIKDMEIPLERRIKFVNLLCELDEPGEWYYERSTGKLFIYPLEELTSEVQLTILGKTSPMITLQDTQNVEIKGITLQNGGDIGVFIHGGKDNVVGGCTIRNFSGQGIRIEGGTHNGMQGCELYGLESAFYMGGGVIKNFTAADHYITNCEMYEIRNKGYGLGVLSGFAMTFSHNLVHDTNGGINFSDCGEFIAEYNEFYRSGFEMGDWNPLYSGPSCVAVGCILRYNFIHHLMELPNAYPVGGMRGDDDDIGNTYYGNIFYKSGRRGFETFGPGVRVLNNIILECKEGIAPFMLDEEGRKKLNEAYFADCYNDNYVEQIRKGDYWRQMLYTNGDRFYYNSPDWSFRYPLLRMLMNRAPHYQTYVEITRNYTNNVELFISPQDGVIEDYPETALLEKEVEIPMTAFQDVECLDFNFREDFKPMDGFYPIPFDEIGLVLDEYRCNVPDKKQYRSEVYQQYKDVKSSHGEYDMSRENDYYPLPIYKQRLRCDK